MRDVNLVPVSFPLELFVQLHLFFKHGHGFTERVQRLLLEHDLLRAASIILVILVVEARPVRHKYSLCDFHETLQHLLGVSVTSFNFLGL